MGKQIRRIVQLITLLAWLCTVTAFAVDMPTVIYDSGKGTFTFQNLDNDGLFGAFQDLMPGDERTTEIRIEMKNLSRSARLYLQAEPNSEDVEVLKTLKLSVKKNGTAYTAKVQQDTHQGYAFAGWYTDEQCTLPYADGTVLDADTTLYGKWTVARGNLSVSKTVTGNAGDTSKAFNFTVTLGNTEINGVFGEMTFVDGVATFVLKHGESKTATGLPSGITYSVTEVEANQDGYTTVASKASGSIMKNDTVTVAFTNTKNSNISEGPNHPDVPSKPGTPSTPANSPNTGDTMNLRLWTSAMGLSLAGLIISLVVVKKNSYRGKRMK